MKIFFIVSLNNVANINSEMYKNHFILNQFKERLNEI